MREAPRGSARVHHTAPQGPARDGLLSRGHLDRHARLGFTLGRPEWRFRARDGAGPGPTWGRPGAGASPTAARRKLHVGSQGIVCACGGMSQQNRPSITTASFAGAWSWSAGHSRRAVAVARASSARLSRGQNQIAAHAGAVSTLGCRTCSLGGRRAAQAAGGMESALPEEADTRSAEARCSFDAPGAPFGRCSHTARAPLKRFSRTIGDTWRNELARNM